MKKILFICLLSLATASFAQNQTITSDYTKGYFVTTVKTTVNTDYISANVTMEKFIDQYKNELNKLFAWALKGVKMRGEQDDFIMFNIKKHTLDNNRVLGVMDVDVPFIKKENKNVNYKVNINKTKISDKNFVVKYEILECEKVFEHATAQITVVQENENKCTLNFEVRIKLRMPYSMMTKKTI